MYRHLLVAVDATHNSNRAVRRAFEIARLLGGDITLLYLVNDAAPPENGPSAGERANELLDVLCLDARRPPRRLVVNTDGQSACDVITRAARELRPDLVLLSTSRTMDRGSLGRLVAELAVDVGVPVKFVPPVEPPARRRASQWLEAATTTPQP